MIHNASSALLLRQDEAGVTTLTLNHGERFNVLSEEMLTELLSALKTIAQDTQVRVVVLAAAGKAFCAGHDLKQMQANPSQAYYQSLFQQCSKLMLAIQHLPQPVIARVHGIATAAGCQLVAMCDLAVAADSARFAVSGINVGLFCSTPAVALSRNISRKQAMEMLLTGDFMDAQTALQRGLVNRVVPADMLDACITELVDSIISKPMSAISMGKQLFYKQLEMGVEAAYQLAGQTMACNMMETSAQEGVLAFIEKRSPKK
ncbi:enoyl-CoA hydratase [Undibacterium jejuense]|uniref:Enoyl-CoA hydratase domain-containing protein 3, mitochondrial n=1 Tax=Undibacterium jejuense TaxID=1344949 RepID=A0A923KQJ5_9BURK|nr:enoyl-CoA hydratase [Undibacterium jejuense]MBC3862916.1 enoyl-CoA hydratase [Undibacterium jejuense]